MIVTLAPLRLRTVIALPPKSIFLFPVPVYVEKTMLHSESFRVVAANASTEHRRGGIIARIGTAVLVVSMLASTCVYGIVSDRHLQGVRALECDLESSPTEFTLLVNARKHTLQLEKAFENIVYEEVSENMLRFQLTLPEAPMRTCELEFPAGALVCTDNSGDADLGFCLTVMN